MNSLVIVKKSCDDSLFSVEFNDRKLMIAYNFLRDHDHSLFVCDQFAIVISILPPWAPVL